MPGFAQLINGQAWDYSSISATIQTPAPVPITQFTALSWTYQLTPGVLRGNSAHKLARSRGQFEATGKCTLYEEEWGRLVLALSAAPNPPGGGYMEKAFDLVVAFANLGSPPSTIILNGCRITGVAMNSQQGQEVLMRELDLDIMKVLENGKSPVRDRSGIV